MLEHTQHASRHSTSISMQVKLHKHKLATHACLRASSSARQTTHAQAILETRPRLSSCARPLQLAKPGPPSASLALTTHARHAGPPRAAAGTIPCRPLPSPHPAAAFRRTHGRAKPHAHSTGDLKTAPPAKVSASPKRRIALPSASSTSPSSQQHRAARRRLGAARPRRQQVQCRGWPHIPGCIPLPGL